MKLNNQDLPSGLTSAQSSGIRIIPQLIKNSNPPSISATPKGSFKLNQNGKLNTI